MDELTAVKESQTGDRDAFGFLISQYYKSIYRYAYQLIGTNQDADDICQETFLRAFEEIKELQNGRCFKGWIFMIATNLSRRYINKKRCDEKSSSTWVSIKMQSGANEPYENLSSNEKATIVQNQLLKMPEQMRMATVLVHIEDFTQKEASEILNCSQATVCRDLERAMVQLRSKLQDLV
jgi:RNA polymerase sigma-70 factor, ECF subfamily